MPLPRPQRICLLASACGKHCTRTSARGSVWCEGPEAETGCLLPQDVNLRGAALASHTAAQASSRAWASGSVFAGETRSHPGVWFQSHLSASSSCFLVSLAQGAGTREKFPLCQSQGLFWGRGKFFLDRVRAAHWAVESLKVRAVRT